MSRLRERIFISYSHADRKWLDQIVIHLKPYVRQGALSIWSDTQIKTGNLWREEIAQELSAAGVALLLVSPDFMASDFIANEELPQILHAAKNEGVLLYWVPIRDSAYETTFLKEIQSRPSPRTPLATMPKAKREGILVDICKEIAQAVQSVSPQSKTATLLDGQSHLSRSDPTKVSTPSKLHPEFALHDFHYYPEDAYGEPRNGPQYPKTLQNALETTIAFIVASSSLSPIWIQNAFIRVLEATPLKQATFPVYETGSNGIPPVLGWVELKPDVDSYKVMTNVKRKVGRGLEPADFHIRVFCREGRKFKVAVEVEWMDLNQQNETARYLFPEELSVELPEMVTWENIVSKAKTLRIFISLSDAAFLLTDFKKMHVSADVTVLAHNVGSYDSEFFENTMNREKLSHQLCKDVLTLSEEGIAAVTRFIGRTREDDDFARPRYFIISDERTLIIEDSVFAIAEVVEDENRIQQAIILFESLKQQYIHH